MHLVFYVLVLEPTSIDTLKRPNLEIYLDSQKLEYKVESIKDYYKDIRG